MGKSSGFTLIELIAVITVLAVLAAVAVPRFIDLSLAAKQAKVEGLAGDLSAASSLNAATFIAAKTYPDSIPVSAFPMRSCSFARFLLATGLPEGYRIEAGDGGDGSVSHRESVQCDLVDESDTSIRSGFVLYGIDLNGN